MTETSSTPPLTAEEIAVLDFERTYLRVRGGDRPYHLVPHPLPSDRVYHRERYYQVLARAVQHPRAVEVCGQETLDAVQRRSERGQRLRAALAVGDRRTALHALAAMR